MKLNIKKISFTVIPLVLTFIICSSSFTVKTEAAWGSISGSSTEYLLESSVWIVKINNLEASGEGAFFNEINIDINTRYEVDVLDVDNVWGVDFKVTNYTSTNSNGLITTDMFFSQFSKFLYYPVEECNRLVNSGFNKDEINRGPPLIQWFFVEPKQDVWDFLDNLTTLEYHNSLPNSLLYGATLEAEREIVDNQVIFDMYMRGTYENETGNTSIQFDHMIKFVWDEITGILLGYRIATYIYGQFQGYSITVDLQIINRQTGFELPRFNFVSGFIPGFGFLITVIGLGTILVTSIIYSRKIKK
ncbi:MAG: choice-of-anchor S family protein [Candidatus Heimdallarchaeota archaeon]